MALAPGQMKFGTLWTQAASGEALSEHGTVGTLHLARRSLQLLGYVVNLDLHLWCMVLWSCSWLSGVQNFWHPQLAGTHTLELWCWGLMLIGRAQFLQESSDRLFIL